MPEKVCAPRGRPAWVGVLGACVCARALTCMWVCECLGQGGFTWECGCFSGVVSTCPSYPALPQSSGFGELEFVPTLGRPSFAVL